jgi:hypothetical protein
MFMVHGGVFTDMTFTKVVEGTQEAYGPFPDREQAVNVWRGAMGRMIDTCEHRLFITDTSVDVEALRAKSRHVAEVAKAHFGG